MQVSIPYGKGKITHICVENNTRLTAALRDALLIDENVAQFLLEIGAVYTNFKRVTSDIEIFPQTILRVHQNPLRFEIEFSWKDRLFFESPDFVIVDKPRGIPTHATLDNRVENLHYQLQQFLAHPLYVTHRLDILTGGLIVLAKTKEFQKAFNSMLQKKEIQKYYHAQTEGQPPIGHHIHFMKPSKYSPKEMSNEDMDGWLKCELAILADGRIKLLTGRTHQIRAQLAHMGFPLIGDPVYSDSKGPFQLTCTELEFECPLTRKPYSFKLKA